MLWTEATSKANMDELDKKYYKISQVSEILEIPISTLRYWEDKFTILKPKRTSRGTRLYTATDIEKIRMVHYLVKERGMKIDAAQEVIKHNQTGINKHYQAITRLKEIREDLMKLLGAINSFRR